MGPETFTNSRRSKIAKLIPMKRELKVLSFSSLAKIFKPMIAKLIPMKRELKEEASASGKAIGDGIAKLIPMKRELKAWLGMLPQ